MTNLIDEVVEHAVRVMDEVVDQGSVEVPEELSNEVTETLLKLTKEANNLFQGKPPGVVLTVLFSLLPKQMLLLFHEAAKEGGMDGALAKNPEAQVLALTNGVFHLSDKLLAAMDANVKGVLAGTVRESLKDIDTPESKGALEFLNKLAQQSDNMTH